MPLAVRQEEEELDRLALELFTKHESQFTPRFPWVLVRVLPREQQVGRILIADGKHSNKPVHEGIVLTTWQPYTTVKTKSYLTYSYTEATATRHTDDIVTRHECPVTVGDHVCYPHWCGQTVPGWDEKQYRVVPTHANTALGIEPNGIILGTLTYPKESVKERLEDILDNGFTTVNFSPVNKAVRKILEEFDVVYKEKGSKTLSGR
jgi:co-chaperonin GroES (HSP10)